MIEDARVLRDEFVPREVAHRNQEVNQLSRILEPVTRGEPGETTILTGPSGTGKTCIARFTVDRLRRQHLDVDSVYVNCWRNYSRFRAAYAILEGIGEALDIHRQSTPHDVLVARLHDYEGPPVVVVLDEIDQLEDYDVLYDLHAIPDFTPILIANREEDLFGGFDDRLTSRLMGSERIGFDRYGTDELAAILAARARWGLAEGAIEDDQLRRIADAAAGDARFGISILRSAARRAGDRGAGRITAEIVTESVPAARNEVHQRGLDTLTPHQRAVYEIIEAHGPIAPNALYSRYAERVDEPKSDRTVRNYLEKLRRYDLIAADGSSHDRAYRLPEPLSETG